MDDELIDDVFEDECQFNPNKYFQNTDTGLSLNDATFLDDQTPSPTNRHPAFKANSSTPDDGWKSFKIDDDNDFDESLLHKVKPSFECIKR